ncbi:MAG: hypothetical protein AB1896_15825 [Thermodesulfobacteriota bacterium]
MECPVCGSTAVVAKTCLDRVVEQVQEGADPYDLIYGEGALAECKSCGCTFPQTAQKSQDPAAEG